MRYNTKRHEIEIGNTVMDYITFGEGEKVLVLIPGLSFKTVRKFAEAFSFMYRIFAKEYTVYVFDRKRQLPIGYTIKHMADDLAQVMKSIGIERADVIGISQGGMIAQYLTLDHPQLVNKLVLGVTLSRLNDTARDVISNWVRLAVNSDYEGITEDMLKIVYSDEYVAKIGKYFPLVSRFGKPKDMGQFAIRARACLTCNCFDRLEEISCPVFVIGAKNDLVLTGEAAEEIAEKLGCECYMYENMGHSAYEETPDFNQRILEFLRKPLENDGDVPGENTEE